MVDRLAELARQRALLSEHLAWLDREIADETVKRLIPKQPDIAATVVAPSAPPLSTLVSATSPTSVANPSSVARAPASDPADILEQFRVAPTAVKQDVRKGCLLYFAAAFLLLGLVVAILYFTIGTHSVE